MDYLNSEVKIAHCDMKPANILKIDNDYKLMIGDFSLSKKLKEKLECLIGIMINI